MSAEDKDKVDKAAADKAAADKAAADKAAADKAAADKAAADKAAADKAAADKAAAKVASTKKKSENFIVSYKSIAFHNLDPEYSGLYLSQAHAVCRKDQDPSTYPVGYTVVASDIIYENLLSRRNKVYDTVENKRPVQVSAIRFL